MVRYPGPEDHPGGVQIRRKSRLDPAERLQRLKERNSALEGAAVIEGAHELALRLLDTRSHSTGGLRQAIESKGLSAGTAEEVITRPGHVGLIDGTAFAEALISDRLTGSGKVGRVLVEEMRHEGLDPKTIEAAMETLEPGGLRQRALELARKRLCAMPQVPRDAAFRKLAGMLARKGYSPSTCTTVVTQVLGEREGE